MKFEMRTIVLCFQNDGVDDIQSLTLNFTAKWFTDPPKSRPRDVINTAFDFVQLRKGNVVTL